MENQLTRNKTENWKQCSKEHYAQNRDKHIAYMTNYHKVPENAEKHKGYMRKYYEQNKEKFKELTKRKKNCTVCDREHGYTNYGNHLRSQKHINLEKLQNEMEDT